VRIRITARTSDLARVQALTVGEALIAKNPDVEIEYFFKKSLGDINLSDPLWKMSERGVFTEDFYVDLMENRCDLVVHSWKDLPLESRSGTLIAATLPRADSRDLLLLKQESLKQVLSSKTARIFSSSPRRAHNLTGFFKSFLPSGEINNINFESIRGNVPTRVLKLFESESCDGLIVAKAALDRLLSSRNDQFKDTRSQLHRHLDKCLWMILPVSENPTAAAQGALAIEIRKESTDLLEILTLINCETTFQAVQEERKILGEYGGGCHQKIGVHVMPRNYGKILSLKGLTDRGETLDRWKLIPNAHDHQKIRFHPSEVWPLDLKETDIFSREPLQASPPPKLAERALFIAKAEALPTDWKISPDKTLVWAAGLETWRKLAKRGLWVNGCQESLGESDPLLPQETFGKPPRWLKMSHQSGFRGDMELCPTYKLVPKTGLPALDGKKCFYWTSFSLFQEALKQYPEIKHAQHACGPGNTYEVLQAELGRQSSIRVFLSHKDWLEEVIQ